MGLRRKCVSRLLGPCPAQEPVWDGRPLSGPLSPWWSCEVLVGMCGSCQSLLGRACAGAVLTVPSAPAGGPPSPVVAGGPSAAAAVNESRGVRARPPAAPPGLCREDSPVRVAVGLGAASVLRGCTPCPGLRWEGRTLTRAPALAVDRTSVPGADAQPSSGRPGRRALSQCFREKTRGVPACHHLEVWGVFSRAEIADT